MQMRKCIAVAAGAAAVLLPLSAASVAQAAPTKAKVDVLTTTKAGGTNVKAKAVLAASLTAKTDVDFAAGSNLTATCSDSSISFTVTSNPAKPGTADLSLTKEPSSKCKVGGAFGSDVSSISVSLAKPPYKATISDKAGKAGFPVSVSSPVVEVTATAEGTSVVCLFTTKTLSGTFSNKTNGISFSKQTLTLVTKGSNSLCSAVGTSSTFSASYSPVKDSSVKGSPKVFVN